MRKIDFTRIALSVFALWGACAAVPLMAQPLLGQAAPATSPAMPTSPAAAASTPAAKPVVNSVLNVESTYPLLLGFFAADAGDLSTATRAMLEGAMRTKSDQAFAQALSYAAQSGDRASMLQVAQTWQTLMPQSLMAQVRGFQLAAAAKRADLAKSSLLGMTRAAQGEERVQLLEILPSYAALWANPDESLLWVTEATEEWAKDPVLWPRVQLARAQMLAARNQFDPALALLTQVFERYPSDDLAARMTVDWMDVLASDAGLMKTAPDEAASKPSAANEVASPAQRAQSESAAPERANADGPAKEAPTAAEAASVRLPADQAKALYAKTQTLLNAYLARHSHADVHRAYASHLAMTDRTDAAKAQIALCVRKHPDDALCHFVQGRMLLLAEDRKGAQAALQSFVQLNEANIQKAKVQPAMNVLAARDQLALLERQQVQAFQMLSQAAQAQGDWASAAQWSDKAVALAPRSVDALFQQATVAQQKGAFDVMEQALRRVIALAPEEAEGYNFLGYSMAERNINLPEARELLEKALALSPDSWHIQDSMAWLLYREGKLPEALELLEKVHANFKDPEVAAHLGEVLWQSSQQERAKQVWLEAMKTHADLSKDKLQSLLDTMKRFGVKP